MPRKIQFVYTDDTKTVSLSGKGCALDCKHCNKHYLKQMNTLDSPTPENTKSFLISGGLKKNGKSFILDKKQELRSLKNKGNYRFNSHVGFVDPEELNEVAQIVDYVSFDFVSDANVIKKVYKLDKDPQEYIAQYKLLTKKIKTYPHVTIGLDEGKIHWEYEAIDILHDLGADRLVLNILIPTKGTEFENVAPPELSEVRAVMKYARKVFKDGLLIVGCMRPGGSYRTEVDKIAIEEGVDRIVKPTPQARKLAEEMRLTISYLYECCALDPVREERSENKQPVESAQNDLLRVSTASAAILDLKKTHLRSKTKTIYLMNTGGCEFDCSFCSQARSASAKEDKLSRVSWPEYSERNVFDALKEKEGVYKRICMQVVNSKDIFKTLPKTVSEIRKSAPKTKIAVTIRTYEMKDIDAMFAVGVDEVGLGVDVVDPLQFQKIKGGDFNFFKNFVLKAGDKYPNKIAVHVIVGMGETEKQMVEVMEELQKHKIIIALFAFTPVPGAKLEFKVPPNISSYRRIQVALYLIRNNPKRAFQYDEEGRIVDFGMDREVLQKKLIGSDVFETSGCKDCNRPYYNERAGSKDLYNYPEKLAIEEFERVFETIFEYVAEERSFRPIATKLGSLKSTFQHLR